MKLIEYINTHFSGNRSAFARHMGVRPQKVNEWLHGEWIVIEGKLYSPKRVIPD